MRETRVAPFLAGDSAGVVRWLEALAPEQATALAVVAAETLARGEHSFSVVGTCVARMTKVPPPFGVEDVRILLSFDTLPNSGHFSRQTVIGLVLAAVRALLASGAAGADSLAGEVADRLVSWNPEPFVNVVHRHPSEVWVLRDQALALAGRRVDHVSPDVGSIMRVDGFGLAAVELLGPSTHRWPPGTAALLAHCATARSARPSTTWARACRSLLAETDKADEVVRALLSVVAEASAVAFMTDHGVHERLLGPFNDDLVRGLVWTAGVLGGDWVVPTLEAVAVRCMRDSQGRAVRLTAVAGEKVQYACFQTLGSIGSPDAAAALGRLLSATSNRTTRKRAARQLESLAERTGVGVDELLETSLPDWGLDPAGATRVELGAATAVLRLDPAGATSLSWLVDGRESKKRPSGVGTADATAVKARQSQLRKAVGAERARVEALLVAGREWSQDDFWTRVVEHRLTGWFARRLFWTVEPVDGKPLVGLPGGTGREWMTPHGPATVEGIAMVRIWHPVQADPQEVRDLRGLAASVGLIQPFRQVWRETYRPDEVERATGLYSSRYAGHVVRLPQVYALARQRHWWGGFVSNAWDGGQASRACRDFQASGVRARWSLGAYEPDSLHLSVDLAVTDRLDFVPLGEKDPAPLPLTEVPPVIFSEAIRDLDLLTTVSTVANDPFWLERFHPGDRQLHDYWETIAAGGFPETVAHRRDAIEAVLHTLPRADRLELADRQLIVRGTLRTYYVDLATANVRIQPGGRWLSFSPTSGTRSGAGTDLGAFAAIDDDVILGRILDRVQVLVADDRIANPALRKQLEDR